MKSRFITRTCLLLSLGLIWLGCQDDDLICRHDNGVFQNRFDSAAGLQKYDEIILFFSTMIDTGALLIHVDSSMVGFYSFEFESNEQLCIDRFFIKNLQYDSAKLHSEITLSNGKIILAPVLKPWSNLIKDSIYVNPFDVNPLCANRILRTPTSSVATMYLLAKNGQHNKWLSFTTENDEVEVSILGLYQDYNNILITHFQSALGSQLFIDTTTIKTELITSITSDIKIDVPINSGVLPGMNLVNSRILPGFNVPYMFDQNGELRWILDYSSHPLLSELSYDVGLDRLNNGNWFFGDAETDAVYEVGQLGNIIEQWELGEYRFHHTVIERDNGNFILSVTHPSSRHTNGRLTVEDFIIEIDRNSGEIITEWDLKESLDEYRTDIQNNLSNTRVDWLHVNSLYYDPTDHTIIISGRYQGVAKLTFDNRLVWLLAPHRGWNTSRNGDDPNDYLLQPLTADGEIITDLGVLQGEQNHPHFEWCWGQHAVSRRNDGRLIVFDNGFNRNYDATETYSRIVEYEIDEKKMTVQQTWSFGKSLGESMYSPVASNIQYDESSDHYFMNSGFLSLHPRGVRGITMEIDRGTKAQIFSAGLTSPSLFSFHRVYRLPLYSK